MKKVTSLLLVFVMTLAIMLTTGCGDKGTSSDAASGNKTTSGSATDDIGDLDFDYQGGSNESTGSNGTTGGGSATGNGNTTVNKGDGEIGKVVGGTEDTKETQGLTTIRIATVNGSKFTSKDPTDSLYAKMFNAKVKEIRKKYKVNVKFISIGVGDESSISTSLFAQNCAFDIMYYTGPFSRNCALNGLLAKQNEISTIDLSKPQFNKAKGFNEGMTFNGNVYGTVFGSELDKIPVIFANQTLIDTYTSENGKRKYDILQLYKDGKWTMDKYIEIANAVERVDAAGKTTVWGASYGKGNGLFLAAYAGGTVCRKIANGKEVYYPAMLSQAGVDCIELLRKMEFEEKSIMPSGGDNGRSGFKNSTVAMIGHDLTEAPDLVTNVDGEVVVVPIPKTPTQKNHLFSARTSYYSIPAQAKNKELIGKIYMELSTINMDAYYESLFIDTGLSEENLKLATKEFASYANAEFIDGVDTTKFNNQLKKAYENGTGSVKTIFDSVKDKFQAAINDCYDRASKLK